MANDGKLLASNLSASSTAAAIVAANQSRQGGVLLSNLSLTVTVYYGGADVTTSNGTPLNPNTKLFIRTKGAIYLVTASSTADCRALEITDYGDDVGKDFSLATSSPSTSNIVGTITNDNALAGNVGEVVSSAIASGSAVSLTSPTPSNVTSISLTAGDWDVEGNINYSLSAATQTQCSGGIGTTSATVPTDGSEVANGQQTTTATLVNGIALPRKRISIATTTTVYLVAKATFSAGTVSAYGSITARRER